MLLIKLSLMNQLYESHYLMLCYKRGLGLRGLENTYIKKRL